MKLNNPNHIRELSIAGCDRGRRLHSPYPNTQEVAHDDGRDEARTERCSIVRSCAVLAIGIRDPPFARESPEIRVFCSILAPQRIELSVPVPHLLHAVTNLQARITLSH
ncbi:hypothetical protein J6590_007521 [Homalodisca vitripennis]|nr:hypothetical protein J6590_007521 [Homalodisca vitripennis]